MKTQDRYEARVRVVKAMAHPTRMFIVEELSRVEERCVCELTEMVGADISTVSNTLSILKNAGIIADEKRGNPFLQPVRHVGGWWLLLGSLVLRAGVPLLGERLDYETGRHTIALAGMLAWLAVAIFAFSVARAVRAEPRTKRALDEVVRNARRP